MVAKRKGGRGEVRLQTGRVREEHAKGGVVGGVREKHRGRGVGEKMRRSTRRRKEREKSAKDASLKAREQKVR